MKEASSGFLSGPGKSHDPGLRGVTIACGEKFTRNESNASSRGTGASPNKEDYRKLRTEGILTCIEERGAFHPRKKESERSSLGS